MGETRLKLPDRMLCVMVSGRHCFQILFLCVGCVGGLWGRGVTREPKGFTSAVSKGPNGPVSSSMRTGLESQTREIDQGLLSYPPSCEFEAKASISHSLKWILRNRKQGKYV
jgi:hypothetical protein